MNYFKKLIKNFECTYFFNYESKMLPIPFQFNNISLTNTCIKHKNISKCVIIIERINQIKRRD